MNKLYALIFWSLILSFGSLGAQPIIMSNTHIVQGITEDIRYFYDPGGPATLVDSGNFGMNIKDTLTIRNVLPETGSLIVNFLAFAVGYGDTLYIFDGSDCNAPLIGFYNLMQSPEEITASGTYLTFVFHSDGIDDYSILKSGWEAQVYVVPDIPEGVWLNEDNHALQILSCNAKFYDSGGPNGNMNATGTYYCEFTSPVSHVKMEFQSFNVKGVMKIYDGKYNAPDRRLIGQFHSTTVDSTIGSKPPVLFSSGSTLCVEYVPGPGDTGMSGWEATITCVQDLFTSLDGFVYPHVTIEDENYVDLPDEINHVCGTPIILNANVAATGRFTNDYTVKSIPFDLHPCEFNVGTQVSANYDDSWIGPVNLGFDFSFFGKIYDKVYPGTNGIISFNYKPSSSSSSGSCAFSYSVPEATPPYSTAFASGAGETTDPNTPYVYKNSVYGVFEDVDASAGGGIYYCVLGLMPARTFVYSFNEVPEFGNNSQKCTYQMVLYEGTNIIDVFVKKRQCCAATNNHTNYQNYYEGIIGIQNNTSSQILIPPGRGMTGWSVQEDQSEAWRFTPVTPMDEDATIEWFVNTVDPAHLIGNKKSVVVNPLRSTTYIAKYHFTNSSSTVFDLYDTVRVQIDEPCFSDDCPVPTVSVSNVDDNLAMFFWTHSGGESSWVLEYKKSSADTWTCVDNITTPAYILTDLEPSTEYFVRVSANCSDNTISDYSNECHFFTPLSLNDFENSTVLYPNPTTGQFRIENSGLRIENVEVYDVYGKQIKFVKVEDHGVVIDLSANAAGVYFTRVTTDKGVVTKRIVKK